ncbi:hypothetical protein MUN84_03215 [Hymenobacter sp. 5516J-16]|uniref:hypothetical protein n=1 Tax=Hymenobacter sp. 5516J-16 TaxID=2932253 RepID=UPI001FD1AB98|nr:hypothetical protein [Hymenobacter sp. 5516J-16]UOQ77697.1 hypothetical protein MUN84_03215 [Hymenobacter sp. 5516J-16]
MFFHFEKAHEFPSPSRKFFSGIQKLSVRKKRVATGYLICEADPQAQKKAFRLVEGFKRKSVADFSVLQGSNSLPVSNKIIRVIILEIIAEMTHVKGLFFRQVLYKYKGA